MGDDHCSDDRDLADRTIADEFPPSPTGSVFPTPLGGLM
jgi:hypothetical protein